MSVVASKTVVQGEVGALGAPAHVKAGCGQPRAHRLDELYRALKRAEQDLADLVERKEQLQKDRSALPVATATMNASDYSAALSLSHAQAEILAAIDKELLPKQATAAEAQREYSALAEEGARARNSIANLREEIERFTRPKIDRIAELEQLLAT